MIDFFGNPTTAAAVPLPLTGEVRNLHPKSPMKGEMSPQNNANIIKMAIIAVTEGFK